MAKATKATKAKKGKGKGKGDKGKGDKGKKDGKGKDKSADKSAGSKGERTEKKCYWYGRKGHLQVDCYFKKEYEQRQGWRQLGGGQWGRGRDTGRGLGARHCQ